MSVEFGQDSEVRRVQDEQQRRAKSSWQLLETYSLVKAVRYAKENGWEERKVQVRPEETTTGTVYYVEPYEEGCGCRGLLSFHDFYGDPLDNQNEG